MRICTKCGNPIKKGQRYRVTKKGSYHRECDKLVGLTKQFDAIRLDILTEMDRLYPTGSEVTFWRTDNQINPSHGVIVHNWCMSTPEIRVRYNGSDHVVSLYPGLTRMIVCSTI